MCTGLESLNDIIAVSRRTSYTLAVYSTALRSSEERMRKMKTHLLLAVTVVLLFSAQQASAELLSFFEFNVERTHKLSRYAFVVPPSGGFPQFPHLQTA